MSTWTSPISVAVMFGWIIAVGVMAITTDVDTFADPISAARYVVMTSGPAIPTGAVMMLTGIFTDMLIRRRREVVYAPEEWDGVARSMVDSLAPLEQRRIDLRREIHHGESLLEDLDEDSTSWKSVQIEIDGLEDAMAEVDIEVDLIIADTHNEIEVNRQTDDIRHRSRRRLDAESGSDAWLSKGREERVR